MRMTTRVRLCALFVWLGCLIVPSVVWAQDEQAIRKLLTDDYDKVENSRDVVAKMRLYTSDVVIVPPEGAITSGADAARAFFADVFTREDFQGTTTVAGVDVLGDLGIAWGTWQGKVTPKAGGTPATVGGKFMTVVRRQPDGSWKIARETWNIAPEKQHR